MLYIRCQFRLTAIRETFEESGVLLHKNDNTSGAYNFSDSSFLKEWREKVHKSPDKLVNLYQELGVYPDIWSLSEYSDWLTPTDLHEQAQMITGFSVVERLSQNLNRMGSNIMISTKYSHNLVTL